MKNANDQKVYCRMHTGLSILQQTDLKTVYLKGRLYHDSREGGMPSSAFGDDTDPGGIIR